MQSSANFRNLERTGRLVAHIPAREEIAQLLTSAKASLADARVAAIGNDTRFDAAYKTIMMSALVSLMAHGFRPATGVPGHHQTMIQLLPVSLGIGSETMVELDTLRRKRNLADYTGQPVSLVELDACIAAAAALLETVYKWLRQERPDLA